MPALKKDLYVEQGATFRILLTWAKPGPPDEDDNPTLGERYNLTDCTARMQIRPKVTSEDVLLTLTTETGEIILGGILGTIALDLTPEQTTTLTVKKGVYDLEIAFPDGQVFRLLQGAVVVSPNVTRGAGL